MAIYRNEVNRSLVNISQDEKMSNQIILYGTDQSFPVSNGFFFLEYLQVDGAGTVTIKDGENNTISTGVTTFSNDYVPLVCPYGIELKGDVAMAKGFFITGCILGK